MYSADMFYKFLVTTIWCNDSFYWCGKPMELQIQVDNLLKMGGILQFSTQDRA